MKGLNPFINPFDQSLICNPAILQFCNSVVYCRDAGRRRRRSDREPIRCRPTTTCSRFARPRSPRVAAPGQFVMVKAGSAHDPLLRRPFSVFEILRDDAGAPAGLSLLNKRIGPSTGSDLRARRRDSTSPASGRSAGRSRSSMRPTEAWMVAGGVGLAPFATLAEVAARPRRAVDAVLRRPAGRGAVLPRSVSGRSASSSC